MTRFVIDAGAAIYLASEAIEVSEEHKLYAPTLLRSEALSALHEAVRRREIPEDVARDRLARIARLKMRLLGDRVLQRRAWEIADRLGWDTTFQAEYVALAELHGCTLVTRDERLARRVRGVVPTAAPDALGKRARPSPGGSNSKANTKAKRARP